MANAENTPAKALGNFLDMIKQVEANENYKPSNPYLLAESMKQLHSNASAALDSFHSSKAIMVACKKERVKTVGIVKEISRRVVNFLKACRTSVGKIEQAMAIYRLIHGYKAPGSVKSTPSEPPSNGEDAKKKSNKQGSQDSLVQNFSKLIQVLKTEPLYTPNEPELKITGLEALVQRFKNDDLATATADAANERARMRLKKLFEDPQNGVNAVMGGVKLYSKAAFGTRSAEYASLSKIKLPNVTL